MKTKHPIGPKKKHYQDKKRQIQHDENVVTPPNKSRRSNKNSGDVAALKDQVKASGSRNVINDMNRVLLEMNSELGCRITAVGAWQ